MTHTPCSPLSWMQTTFISFLHKRTEFVLSRWLVAAAGLIAGLFLARVAYELWPAHLAALVTWPLGPALAVGIAALTTWLYRLSGERVGAGVFAPGLLLLVYVLQPSVHLLQALVLFAGALGASVLLTMEASGAAEWVTRWSARLLLLVAVLAMYLATMGRAVGKADTFEFQVVAPALGVAHPTGYPLYILLGKLFSLLPLGSVAWRVNLTSVVCALVAVMTLYSVIGRVLAGDDVRLARVGALVGALALAASTVFWSQAIVAEVYALNAAFVAGLFWLMMYGLDRRQREPEWNAQRWLLITAFVYGLSLTNHLTMVLMAPVVLLSLGWVRPRISLTGWLQAIGLFALGLSVYGYILVRWPALHQGQWMPLGEFVGWITGRQFGGALQPALWRDPTRWQILARLLLQAYGPVGAGLAVLGLVGLVIRRRRIAAITALAFGLYCSYALIYNIPDISVFLIPAHLVMAAWLACAIWLAFAGHPYVRRLTPCILWLFILLPLSLIWTNLPQVDQSRAGQDLMEWGRYVLALPLPRGSAILADSEKIAPLYYLKSIEGVRRDVDMLVLGSEELYRAELERRVAQGQPVYLARFLPGLAGVYRLHSLGPLVRVSTTPQTSLPLAPITQPLNVSFGAGKLELLGYDFTPGQGNVACRLTLYWRARMALTTNYHVRMRLVSETGAVGWQDAGAHPVSGYNPTVAWQPDEVIADYHEIPVVPALPPGRYRLQVGLFLPFSDEGLLVDGVDQAWYGVLPLELGQHSLSPLPVELRANFGGQVLLRGASLPGVIPPGGRGEVTLEWEKLAPSADYRLQVTLARADGLGRVVQIVPFGGEYPLSQWEAGQRVQMQVHLTAPEQPGQYTLRVGWVTPQDRWVAARCGWMGNVVYECPVVTLRVEGTPRAGGINFADQVILVSSQLGRQSLAPGEQLGVNLRWQGLKTWPADYTVFVQLVGPDGRLYGQVDAYPVQGTLPTTQWQAGQTVDDPYLVTLAPDAPPGKYQVHVGWYLLATLRRLNVLDAEGRPVDDHVVAGTVEVSNPSSR